MKKKVIALLVLTWAGSLEAATAAELIGWVPDAKDPYNLCQGYYRELPIVYHPNILLQDQTHNYDTHADSVEFTKTGDSVLTGHVSITQPGQEVKANIAYLRRPPQGGHIQAIDAEGAVGYYAPGVLMVGDKIHIDIPQKTATLTQATYRTALSDLHNVTRITPLGQELDRYQYNVWGQAKTVTETSPRHFTLHHATFSTCSPSDYSWHLHSSSVNLDTQKGVGRSWNSVLYAGKLPVFYFPYVSFPLNHQRKSGFLTPLYNHSQNSGTYYGLPYYWNIAPNMDDTFTPGYYPKRGFKANDEFRFLTPHTRGGTEFDFLPNDVLFHKFQKSAQGEAKYASRPQGLAALSQDSDTRYELKALGNGHWGDHWSSDVDYTTVSDDYYPEDFGVHLVDNSTGQLLQKADVAYSGEHWDVETLVQGFQDLHPVDQAIFENQYQRLPEVVADGSYELAHGLLFSIGADTVRFQESKTPDTGQPTPVNGDRLSLNPSFSDPLQTSYGYLTPRLQLRMNQYSLQHNNQLAHAPSDAIPLFDIDSGLYFERQMNLFGLAETQTLEPQLYYLYVPYQNQNGLPIFDTSTQSIDYNYLFLDNRFAGVDRVGDANQLTYALTTRMIDSNTGDEQGSASIGQIAYFTNRRVLLCDKNQGNCQDLNPIDRQTFSPVAGQLTFNLPYSSHITGNLTWDPYQKQFINQSVTFGYQPQADHVINIGYNFIRSGGAVPGTPANAPNNDLKQTDISSYWTFYRNWSVMGRWNYSWSHQLGNAYLAGLGYTSCCWSIRIVESRAYQGQNTAGHAFYNNTFYVQFALNGLGGGTTAGDGTLIQQSIPGIRDRFGLEQ